MLLRDCPAKKSWRVSNCLFETAPREAQARAERERDSAKPPSDARSLNITRSTSAIARSLNPVDQQVKKGGLPSRAIIGRLTDAPRPGESIGLKDLVPNEPFTELMHSVIERYGLRMLQFETEARGEGDGTLYIVDERASNPDGNVSTEDIIGSFMVEGGQIIPGSYSRNPYHLLLSQNGLFRLPNRLHAALMKEISSLPVQASDGIMWPGIFS